MNMTAGPGAQNVPAGTPATATLTVNNIENPPGSGLDDAFQVNYFSNLTLPDGVINVTNAGTSAGSAGTITSNNLGGPGSILREYLCFFAR